MVHARFKTSALNHEARNHTVKNGVVVVALVHIGQEVGCGFGGFFRIEFEGDDAVAGDVQFYLGVAHGVTSTK